MVDYYVASFGYYYEPGDASSVAFFPAYPLGARFVAGVAGVGIDRALLIVSNSLLAATFVLFYRYLSTRDFPRSDRVPTYALLALGLAPTSFFFRMGYSESLFLLLTAATLFMMERKGPLLAIAGVVGLATATRSAGVGLIPGFVLHAWNRPGTVGVRIRNLAGLMPVACWGLLAFMTYQWATFGDPLAFAKAQDPFKDRPSPPFPVKLLALATLEPIRAEFSPSSAGYWVRQASGASPLLSLRCADPFLFLSALALTVVGRVRKVLNWDEFLVSLFLVLTPYVAIGYEAAMRSQGRYSWTALPVYIVLGDLLHRLPGPVASWLLALGGALMVTYAALFCAGYLYI